MRLSDGEWKVMEAVWAGGAVTARDVHDAVGPGTAWAYTTVKTMLDRLVRKGALAVRRDGPAGVYEARVTRAAARGTAVRGLVERAFDGAFAPLLHHLVEGRTLSPREREDLRRLLDDADAAAARRPRGRRGKARP